MPSVAAGLITEPAQAQAEAEAILASGEADVILLARELLRDPYFARRVSREFGYEIRGASAQFGHA